MTVNDLTFTQNAINRWQAKFNSGGSNVTVQVLRDKESFLIVYANLPGMEKVAVYTPGGNAPRNLLFSVDVPEGMEVTIESGSEVVKAKIMG